jgi:hypothetical protein
MKTKSSILLAASILAFVILAPNCSAAATQWGAYVDGGNIAQFESLVGKTADIQAVFTGWGSNGSFPAEYKTTVAGKGKTLLIFWEPSVNYDSILSGKWDSYMASFAAAAKNYGGPVILAPFHEMNGNWDVWGGTVGTNNSQKMIAAWRHVHGLFSGATNVKFAFAPNNDSVPDTLANAITAYYPGSAYVDYVGVDGFNFGTPWQSWQSVFSSAIGTLAQYNKPIYIFSTAACSGAQKAQWIADMGAGVKQYGLAGWVWFNENKECDWRVNSDANSLAAFKAIAAQAANTVAAVVPASPAPVVTAVPAAPAPQIVSEDNPSEKKWSGHHHRRSNDW